MRPLIKKTVGVSFNLADPYQQTLYKRLTEHTNMSAYIKRLIDHDMHGMVVQRAEPKQEVNADQASTFI